MEENRIKEAFVISSNVLEDFNEMLQDAINEGYTPIGDVKYNCGTYPGGAFYHRFTILMVKVVA